MSVPYVAHGWTAHEFRIMLVESRPTFCKVPCEDCGKVYIIAITSYLVPGKLCSRCYERPCHAQ